MPVDGYLVATNYFIDPPDGWPILELPPPHPYNCWTNERLNNALVFFAEIYKGGFNTELMQNLLEIPLNDGGIGFANNAWYETVFSNCYRACRS